jgi:hypothetical protein
MSETQKQIIGQATEAEIANWKKQHGDIFAISVEDHVAYFKKPDRKTVAYAATQLKQSPINYVEAILENTFIGGSKDILVKDEYFMAAMTIAEQLLEVKTAELVKL